MDDDRDGVSERGLSLSAASQESGIVDEAVDLSGDFVVRLSVSKCLRSWRVRDRPAAVGRSRWVNPSAPVAPSQRD